jgi:hypothetical protein
VTPNTPTNKQTTEAWLCLTGFLGVSQDSKTHWRWSDEGAAVSAQHRAIWLPRLVRFAKDNNLQGGSGIDDWCVVLDIFSSSGRYSTNAAAGAAVHLGGRGCWFGFGFKFSLICLYCRCCSFF